MNADTYFQPVNCSIYFTGPIKGLGLLKYTAMHEIFGALLFCLNWRQRLWLVSGERWCFRTRRYPGHAGAYVCQENSCIFVYFSFDRTEIMSLVAHILMQNLPLKHAIAHEDIEDT